MPSPCLASPVTFRMGPSSSKGLLDDALGWVGCPAHPKAPFMVGCEPRETLSCRFGVLWNNSPSRKWAFHVDGKLHPLAAAVSQGQVCFPAQALSPSMGNDLHQTGSNQSPSATHAKPGDFTDLLQRRTPQEWASMEVGASQPHKNPSYKQQTFQILPCQ